MGLENVQTILGLWTPNNWPVELQGQNAEEIDGFKNVSELICGKTLSFINNL